MLSDVHRDPMVEEGLRNLVLQNRCGNRLTLLGHADRLELECVYKPNARRRKDYTARNFSDRDNFTALFTEACMPDLGVGAITAFDYDPFITRLDIGTPGGGRNRLTLVNLPHHNAFALGAPAPLTLTFTPHDRFTVTDGLLTEYWLDRGEPIVSFVVFDGFRANRYRRLRDGRHVLQLVENDVLLIGGEEGEHHVRHLLADLRPRTLDHLVSETEAQIKPTLDAGRLTLADDAETQRVVDLNRRLAWSAIDQGGASSGALNRVYHLIWTRDGSMSSAAMAQAGTPDLIRTWAPFLLENPSVMRGPDGQQAPAFTQLVGTRWSKTEDDGIYYALLSLYTLAECVGEDRALNDGTLDRLLDQLDHAIDRRFDRKRGLFGSDVLGEDALDDSPYLGYDVVNGTLDTDPVAPPWRQRIRYCYTLYQNVNMINALRMSLVLIDHAGQPAPHAERIDRYRSLAEGIEAALAEQFVNERGEYRALLALLKGGGERWMEFAPESDFWEYAWAVSMGPYLPDPATCLRSTRMCLRIWPEIASYGFCPWNYLTRMAKEHGATSAEYRGWMTQQVDEALALTEKYPMPGAVTEYAGQPEGWRGLPFGAGSLTLSICSLLAQPLLMGLAVRASPLLDRVDDFRYRGRTITFTALGEGDTVTSAMLNGRALDDSLQLPEAWLRLGRNDVSVTRGAISHQPRLFGSTARLHDLTAEAGVVTASMSCPFATHLIFDRYEGLDGLRLTDDRGHELRYTAEPLADTGRTLVRSASSGSFTACWNVPA